MTITPDNLTQLLDPDLADVKATLLKRLQEQKIYTAVGSDIVVVNTDSVRASKAQQSERADSLDLSSRYSSPKPPGNPLPPHTYDMVHNVYNDVISSGVPSSILVVGVSGSGTTVTSDEVIAQLIVETKVFKRAILAQKITKAKLLLDRVTSVNDHGQDVCLGSKVVTVSLGDGGGLATAHFEVFLLDPRKAMPRTGAGGHLSIVYDVMAALLGNSNGTHLNLKERHRHALLSCAPTFTKETFRHHHERWGEMLGALDVLGLRNQQSQTGRSSSIVDILVGLAVLVSLPLDIDLHSERLSNTDMELVDIASQALALEPRTLLHILMAEARRQHTNSIQGKVILSRDNLVIDLYTRLVKFIKKEVNRVMPDVPPEAKQIRVVDLQTFDQHEDFCQNFIAEQIESLIADMTLNRYCDVMQSEKLKPPTRQKLRCHDLAAVAFSTNRGVFSQLEMQYTNPGTPDLHITASLRKHFKDKKDLVVFWADRTSGLQTFQIKHSYKDCNYDLGQDFQSRNIIIPNSEAVRVFSTSGNTILRDMYGDESRSNPVEINLYSTLTQVELKRLLASIYPTIPNVVRCLRLHTQGMSHADANPMTDFENQIKASSLAALSIHRRFQPSCSFSYEHFAEQYLVLAPRRQGTFGNHRKTSLAVLRDAGISEKFVKLGSSSIYLLHWQKEKLDRLRSKFIYDVTLVQAQVRGVMARHRLTQQFGSRLSFMKTSADLLTQEHADQARVWTAIVDKTIERLPELPHSTWAKVVVLSQGQQLAKFYAEELSVLVDGSRDRCDDVRLGLGRLCHDGMTAVTRQMISDLHGGIELRRVSDGTVLARRLCQLPVTVRRPSCGYLSEDLIRTGGALPLDTWIKILDIHEFKSLILLAVKKGTFMLETFKPNCVVQLDVGQPDRSVFGAPLSLTIVNILALRLMQDKREVNALVLQASQLSLEQNHTKDIQHMLQEKAKQARQRQRWSRSDQRPVAGRREDSARAVRDQLRRKGEEVGRHMKYSWQEERATEATINMDQLYEQTRRQSKDPGVCSHQDEMGENEASPMSRKPSRQWAKVDTDLRIVSREMLTKD